jgi:hypothetical protein
LFFEAGLRKFGSVAKSFTVIIFQGKTLFGFSFTLAPGCRVWILVSVFAFWVGKNKIGISKFSTVLSGFKGSSGFYLKQLF